MAAIHQLVAGFAKGDAISNEAIAMRAIFLSWGCESEIFSERRRILPELRKEARDIGECARLCRPADIALLHLSIGSPVNEAFLGLPCRKAILYHNITPSRYFQVVQPAIAYSLAKGLQQAKALAGAASLNLADSRFNAGELEAMGYHDVRVLPLVLDFVRLKVAPDCRVLQMLGGGKANVLFVGRCAPNKKIEDALKAFACFQKGVEPASRFIHVGSFAGTERYHHFLLSIVRDLKLDNVVFAGAVPPADLAAYYRSAQVFLCMSEHEGFCIPLIESMFYDVPILAHAAAAVPETLDGAGCLFHEKPYEAVAEMMGRLVRDDALRAAVLARQRDRLRRYMGRNLEAELRQHLAPLLG